MHKKGFLLFKGVLKPFKRFLWLMHTLTLKKFYRLILKVKVFVRLQKKACLFFSFCVFVFLFFSVNAYLKRFYGFSLLLFVM